MNVLNGENQKIKYDERPRLTVTSRAYKDLN